MSLNPLTKLINFRKSLYPLFPKRKDAIMNLLDALTSYGHECKSVVQLCKAVCFERQYSSITDAIADGLPNADWSSARKLAFEQLTSVEQEQPNYFIVDCTPNPRPHAQKLADRYVTHAPNPAPGNKPICVGHQYSVITAMPHSRAQKDKKWVMPISAKRVPSHNKGNELGMQQLNDCIDELELTEKLNVAVTDSLYGTHQCREISSAKTNLVHIFRLRNNRNVFLQPEVNNDNGSSAGRKKEFGDKMNLGDEQTHIDCDESCTTTCVTTKGKTHIIVIKCWKDVLLRGTGKFRSSQHPINLIQVIVTDEQGNSVFKLPLWLAVSGQRRHELSLMEVQQAYAERYDIEHFFRFGKGNLLMDAYQTPDVEHEELWWQLCMLAYVQLYMASGIVPMLPQPWERYLPEFKQSKCKDERVSSPSKTQRGFATVLESTGTPAQACRARGNPLGRQLGDSQVKRESQPVIFKTKQPSKKAKNNNLRVSEFKAKKSEPQTIEELLKLVHSSLKECALTPDEFTELLKNSS